MFYGKYKIANTIVGINSVYETVQKMCMDYSSEEEAEFEINITQKDIDFEKSDEEIYPEDYLETLAVYRAFAEKVIDKSIVLFHGSAICVDNEAFIFMAKSGTGKSTHTALWKKEFKESVMINDDKPMVEITEKGATVYGTPWNGKHNIGNNISCPLKAICFIERDKENSIEEITFKKAYAKILAHIYQSKNEQNLKKILKLIDKIKSCRFYILKCNQEPEAAHIAYRKMKGK